MKSAPARTIGYLAATLVTLCTGAAVLRAAQGSARPEMTVDFLALTNDGAPITDLKAEDVTLRVGGKQRPIKSLKLVTFSDGAPAAAPAKPAGPPAPFGTNVGLAAGGGEPAGRIYQFIVDTESIRPGVEKVIREAIEKLLATLTPRDRVGLINAPRPTLNIPLTTNHANFRTAMAQLNASGTQASNECRSRDLLDLLKNVVSGLNPAEGPATVVLMSDRLSASGSGGGCEITNSDFQRVPSVLAAARARLYVVMAKDVVAERNEGLEMLAGVTNAGAVMRLAQGDNPLARIAKETGAHYVATFDVEPNERTGQMARVELRTSRSGATLRSNGEIAMSKGDAAAPGASMATDMPAMLKSSAAFPALPLRAAGFFPTRGENNTIRLLAMLETVDSGVKLTGAGAGLFDSKNSYITSAAAKQITGGTVIVPLEVPGPGSYRVRFVATDEKGRGGAVDHTLDIDLATLGPLKFSGLLLGAPGPNGCTPKLQFTTEENLCAFVEMYGAPTAQMSATLEIVPAAGGKPVASAGMGGSQTSQPDRFNLSVAQVPIASLPPGDYTVRAVIGMQGAGEAVITRILRKSK